MNPKNTNNILILKVLDLIVLAMIRSYLRQGDYLLIFNAVMHFKYSFGKGQKISCILVFDGIVFETISCLMPENHIFTHCFIVELSN